MSVTRRSFLAIAGGAVAALFARRPEQLPDYSVADLLDEPILRGTALDYIVVYEAELTELELLAIRSRLQRHVDPEALYEWPAPIRVIL